MEQLKENAALTGSRSSGVAPWQEKMNREAANGSSVLQIALKFCVSRSSLF